MKLQVPFVQFPLRFDAERLLAEIRQLGEDVWRPHPQGYAGNSALPLIAVDGDPSSDSISGHMRPTPHLQACPYLQQTMASLGAVWGRSRLMRLSGHAEVPAHADLAYYWRERVRVHVPILTQPTVRFICGESEVNMAAGECWIFDTWRMHRVINAANSERIHLVADTVGSDRFWEIASGGRVPDRPPVPGWQARLVEPEPSVPAELIYESVNLPTVMSPWELREHLNFLVAECNPHPQLAAVQQCSAKLGAQWTALWAEHGDAERGWPVYRAALDAFGHEMKRLGQNISLRNGSGFLMALAPMVLRAALDDRPKTATQGAAGTDPDAGAQSAGPAAVAAAPTSSRAGGATSSSTSKPADPRFDSPIFIVSPPRSGSTLLFETLARAPGLHTIGGESHGRVEGMTELHPAASGWESNRLGVDAATPSVISELRSRFDEALRDRDGATAPPGRVRMLEKTPKNALRIPFLRKVFPEARFIYLYRDPREVLSSMIEAWNSGRFRTYPNMPEWSGPPWSLVLVPGWRELRGKPLPEIVAHQWEAATRILLDDLAEVPAPLISTIRYDAFLANPDEQIRRLCSESGLDWDIELGAKLPNSRHTVSAPSAEKWRRHAQQIETVWPLIDATRMRAEAANRT